METTKGTTKRDPAGGAGAAELFTVDQLAKISQNPDPVYYDLAGDRAALIPEMKKGGIVTKNQITAFLANVCQETDRLKTLEEYGNEAYFRSFLGAEWRYHGRGYIMNTWRAAYQRLSHVLGVDLVSNPDLLAQRKDLAARAAVWYWTLNNIGPVADGGNFEGVCSLINRGELVPRGPINGWEERLAAYERAKTVLGTEPKRETSGSAAPTETELLTAKEGTNFRKGLDYIRPIIGHREYWVWSGGPVPSGEGMYAVNEELPPVAQIGRINCLLGDTKIAASDVERSYKRVYHGEIVTIKTASGKHLTGTPNHPVLTGRGWVALNGLRKGDHVVSSRSTQHSVSGCPDENRKPIPFHQLHCLLADVGDTKRHPVRRLDFHGDGVDGEVDVVNPGGLLGGRVEAPLLEHLCELPLASPNVAQGTLIGDGASDASRLGLFASAQSGVGGPGESLAFLGGHALVPHAGGFGVGAGDTSLFESGSGYGSAYSEPLGDLSSSLSGEVGGDQAVGVNVDAAMPLALGNPAPLQAGSFFDATQPYTGLDEPLSDSRGGGTEVFSQLGDGLPSGVCLDKVVHIKSHSFSGHVYNLQTQSGQYIANSIITHNCAGTTNLFFRAMRKRVPTKGNPLYDGGVAAYAGGVYGPGYFEGYSEPFNLEKAKSWARETRCGVLLLRPYWNASLSGQGHVAILLPSGYVLQSFVNMNGPDLNWDYTIEQSNAGGYYKAMVHPENWSEYEGDEWG